MTRTLALALGLLCAPVTAHAQQLSLDPVTSFGLGASSTSSI